MYQPVWIMDTDNRYGFGQQEDGTSTPSWINTFQRGPEESVWDTVPQPDWDALKYGGANGFLDLFNNGGGSFAAQYKYTDAPDADARMVQAAYWADTYAKAQGKSAAITATLAKAAATQAAPAMSPTRRPASGPAASSPTSRSPTPARRRSTAGSSPSPSPETRRSPARGMPRSASLVPVSRWRTPATTR
jgi:hypothetical protein